jgi:hypothetical protein
MRYGAGNGRLCFELWLTMGGLMAASIFASSVIAMPLLLDRSIDVRGGAGQLEQTVLANLRAFLCAGSCRDR